MNAPADKPADEPLEQGFGLGELTVDPNAGEVAGPGGREKLDPKVMDVLVMLARNAGHVVLREDLLARLWPNAVVTDESLSRCIYELRRQLSLAGGDERYKAMVETVPKRGYRLNGEVVPVAQKPRDRVAARLGWPSWAAIAVVIAAAAALWYGLGHRVDQAATRPSPHEVTTVATSIAVLPFDDLSTEQDQQHFSDGISEEIINRLNQTRTLKVIARTSAFSFRGQDLSIPAIAAKLNVSHVLEGSVRKSDGRIRITTRLVEASSDTQVWSRTYDREIKELFAVQDEIAEEVATALNATLAGGPSHVPDDVTQDQFWRGEFFYHRRAAGDIKLAIKYYQQAIALDADYANAWAALAGAYSLLAADGDMDRDVALRKQGEAARKAVELDPNLAVGLARLAQYYFDTGDRARSYRTFDRAIARDPNDVLVLTFAAGIAMRDGNVAEAIGRYDRIVVLEPRSASYHANRGIYLQAAGRFDEAKAELQTAREFNPDLGPKVDLAIARILVLQKRYVEANSLVARLPEGELQDHALALLRYAEGRRPEADAALSRLVEQSMSSVDIRLAEVYAFRGMVNQAFEALQGIPEAIDRNAAAEASQLWSWQVELRVSPFLKTLHGDPRWQAMLFEPA